jgi:pre-mRNA-splicing factor ATP-dependent RNA helicase DHX15/PRP43
VTEIRPDWLLELAANYYDLNLFTDGETKRALQGVLRKQMKLTNKKRIATSSDLPLPLKKKARTSVS